MIRKYLSILLIITISSNVVQFAIPLSWYLSNYQYISTELCINKLKPEIKCNGMCQLKKKLDENHDHHHEHSQDSKHKSERNVRIDLFVTEKPQKLFASALESETWLLLHQDLYSGWITEPVSPPPKSV